MAEPTAFAEPIVPPSTMILGRYRVEERIGQGGQASVYAAVDVQSGSPVALKIQSVGADLVDELRTQREAEVLARLRSPHVVRIIEARRETDDGPLVIVMDRVFGLALGRELAARPDVSVAKLVGWLVPIADALAEAHALGILHRDVKPGNILVAHDGAKLVDFGVARASGTTPLTTTGSALGTPAYMPPEQLRGDKDVDGRVDQYALATILYRHWAKRLPHPHLTTPTAPTVKLTSEEPAFEPLGRLRPDLPAPLAAAIDRALSLDRERRWPTMAAFADALRPWATEATGPNRRASRAWVLGASTAAATFLGGGALFGLVLASRSPTSTPVPPPLETPRAPPAPDSAPTTAAPSPPKEPAPAALVDAHASKESVVFTVRRCPLTLTACERERVSLESATAPCASMLPTVGSESCFVSVDVTLAAKAGPPARTEVLMRTGSGCRLSAEATRCLQGRVAAHVFPARVPSAPAPARPDVPDGGLFASSEVESDTGSAAFLLVAYRRTSR